MGDRLVQKDLAESLRLVAEQGAKVVHGGSLGRAIDAAMRNAGGFLSINDLVANKAEWWKPISINYRGYEVITASPPANSFDMLVRLGMMETFNLSSLGHNSTEYLHRFAPKSQSTASGFVSSMPVIQT